MKKLLYGLSTFVFGFILAGAVTLGTPAYAATASGDDACQTLSELNPDGNGCGDSNGDVNSVIKLVINIMSTIAGIIAVIMIIVSGLKYITAQGDSNQISSAKRTLIYAIVGLVIVVFAQILVRFTIGVSSEGKLPPLDKKTSYNLQRANG